MVGKIGLLSLLLVWVPCVLFGQETKIVYGRTFALFHEAAEILPNANITLFEAEDSTLIKGVTSNVNGEFSIGYTAAEKRQYLLRVSFIGMESRFFTLDQKPDSLDLGNVVLTEGMELPEFIVTAPLKEMVQVGDTTVINAEAFQTPEGAYLEELVKRIPGLEYDAKTASILYNGVAINAINVNGKEFFSGDNRMALENLPVELISKIKVYDKRSELEKVTGVRSGGENYVLDIQTKEEFNGALLASGKMGRGNNGKKELEVLGNYFKQNGENVSVILNSGNRHKTTRYKNNIDRTAGINFTVNSGEKFSLNGNVAYMGSRDGNQSSSYSEQYLASGNQYQLSSGENTNSNKGLNSFAGLQWEIDEKTYLNFFGNLNIMSGESDNNNRQAMFNSNPEVDLSDPFGNMEDIPREEKINETDMKSSSSNSMNAYSFSGNLTRKISGKGASVSLTWQLGQNRSDNEGFTNSSTAYYRLQDVNGNDSILNRMQSQLSPAVGRDYSTGLMFTYPFTEKFNIQLSYNLAHNVQKNDRNTYDISSFIDMQEGWQPDNLPEGYESGYIDSLSNRSDSRTLGHDLSFRMNYNDEVWDLNSFVTIRPERRSLDQKTGLLEADSAMRTIGFQPFLMASWKKEKLVLRLHYQGNTQSPSLSDLLSLTDNSDPLNITRGNPQLKPSYNQSLRFEINDSKRDVFASLGWQNAINSTTRAMIYNLETGGRESYPVNINGNWSGNASLRYMKRVRSFRIAARTGGTYSQNVNLINEGKSEQPERSVTRSKGMNGNLRLSYLPKWGSFELAGDWRFQYSHNSLRKTDNYVRNYGLTFSNFANLPGNIQLKNDATYSLRNGTNIGNRDDQFVWNTGVSWRFMKKKQGELSAYWSDILSKKKDYNRNVTADGFYESRTRQIGSYFIVSFRYSLNRMLQ